MKVLLVGDIHLSDRPPSIRTETYSEDILNKLEYTVDVANTRGVDAVVWAGDVFHIKTPSRTSHALVQRTIETAAGYTMPLYIVPGNHDMQHDRLDSIFDTQPLGVVFMSGVAQKLVGELDGLFGIPYLQDWRTLGPWMEAWQKSEALLMVTHAPIFPPGETVPYDFIDAEDWAKLMARSGCVYYGHIHDTHGDYMAGDSRFCNQGALSRGSLHESTLKRSPAVTLWNSSTEQFERIEVPHKPAREVFRLDIKEIDDAQEQRLDEFLDSVGETTLEKLSVESVIAHIEAMEGLTPRTREVIREALEEAMA